MDGQPAASTLLDIFPSELLPWGSAIVPESTPGLPDSYAQSSTAGAAASGSAARTATPEEQPQPAPESGAAAARASASGDAESGKKKSGRKPASSEPSDRRKAQNRAAQRAFRERKEKYIKQLESRVKELEELTKVSDAATLQLENAQLRALVQKLEAENYYLKGMAFNPTQSLLSGPGAAAVPTSLLAGTGGTPGTGLLGMLQASPPPPSVLPPQNPANRTPAAAGSSAEQQQQQQAPASNSFGGLLSPAASMSPGFKLPHQILQPSPPQSAASAATPPTATTTTGVSASAAPTDPNDAFMAAMFPNQSMGIGMGMGMMGGSTGMGMGMGMGMGASPFSYLDNTAMASYLDMAQSLGLPPTAAAPNMGGVQAQSSDDAQSQLLRQLLMPSAVAGALGPITDTVGRGTTASPPTGFGGGLPMDINALLGAAGPAFSSPGAFDMGMNVDVSGMAAEASDSNGAGLDLDVNMDLTFNADAFLTFATSSAGDDVDQQQQRTVSPPNQEPMRAPDQPMDTSTTGAAAAEDEGDDCLGPPIQAHPACPVEALREKQRQRLYQYLIPKPSDSSATAQWKAAVSSYLADRLIDVDELCEMMTMQATCADKRRFILEHVQKRHLAVQQQISQQFQRGPAGEL
ncbi:DNA-binding transcription factor yap1 [Blastocladiella emersonii ATCC 22665]|nr:DNA-binding transcription factor yap1 [Blastocladiella emersonii ATCC 22665]